MRNLCQRLIAIPTQFRVIYNNNNHICRNLSVTSVRKGFEEFFPPGVYEGDKFVDEEPVVGRRWKISELRIRSNSDLHKFWFVLLKERNMLLTMRQECKRLGIPMPGATRYNKVKQSMKMVELVIDERQKAILELEKERWYKFDKERESEEGRLSTEDYVTNENVGTDKL